MELLLDHVSNDVVVRDRETEQESSGYGVDPTRVGNYAAEKDSHESEPDVSVSDVASFDGVGEGPSDCRTYHEDA